MRIEILPESLLRGKYLHCRPVENGTKVAAQIVPSEDDSIINSKVIIVCPQRRSGSCCALRDKPGVRGPRRCLWWKGDSRGVYQIIGPNMHKKTEGEYKRIL